ncbi:MFS transporter [Lactococcus protaetiae]|uniref:MFS transporter n=1 Tax=Lactococcus protaetiae TaxID=2592653 RepID=A0A514ZAB7_9LACT|nr:MFS transporter [Lactococcus protaetiae]QDK71523.1 MFS transporter [Lactococcus protaetiae]
MTRNIKFLFASRVCSEFTQAMYPIVLPLFILQLHGSLRLSGVFFAIVMLPSMLFIPFIGTWIEKFSKQKIISFFLLISSFLFVGQFILLISIKFPSLFLLGMFAILITISADTSELASKVLFTEIVSREELEKYNGMKSLIDNISGFGAPILGTVIYGCFGFKMIVLLGGILYLISSGFMTQLSYTRRKQNSKSKTSFFVNMKNGIRPIQQNRIVLNMVLLSASLNFFVASGGDIINPGILIQKYHISNQLFGMVEVAFMIGVALSGLIILKKTPNLKPFLPRLFILDSIVMIIIGVASITMIGINKLLFLLIFLVLEVVLGFVTILINVPIISLYQSEVVLEYQSRFFGFNSFLGKLAITLGTLYTGFLSQTFGADTILIINNICVIIIVGVTFGKAISPKVDTELKVE